MTGKRPPPPRNVQHAGPAILRTTAVSKRVASRRRMALLATSLVIALAASAGGYVVFGRRSPLPDKALASNMPPATQQPAIRVKAPASRAPVVGTDDARKTAQPSAPPAPAAVEASDTAAESNIKKSKSETDEPLGLVTTQQPQPGLEHAAEPEPIGIVADNPATGLPAEPEKKGLVAKPPLGLPVAPPQGIPAAPPAAIFAERTKPKTPEQLSTLGGSARSQAAVEDGLNWLARHQAYDGHWGADCVGAGPKSRCEPEHPCDGAGQPYEAAQTGLAVLAFQAGGHYYFNDQKYSQTVERGLRWFVEQQSGGWMVGSQNLTASLSIGGSGGFERNFMYEHAIATFALCEACAVALAEGREPEPLYLDAATKAVRCLEHSQHADGGWRYTIDRSEQSDCSVSGWVMLALKTAQEAHIKVDQRVMGRMVSFFRHHRLRARTIYKSTRLQGTDAIVGVGMLVDEFINHQPHSSLVEQGASLLADKAELPWGERDALPECDYYLWYNCTLAMFQAGGSPWERWNKALRDHVIERQLKGDDCQRGSWPPDDRWSNHGGRVYSTALAVLTLEVYYRFQRIAEHRVGNQPPPR
jgi:hypothetical protein